MGRVRWISEETTYHLMARGNNRQRVFEDDSDRATLMGLLERVTEQRSWIGYAYCLMNNHIHLVATTPKADVHEGMRDLLSRYARHFNRRHGRSGHLFSERYRMVVIENDAHLLATIRYIARNPIRAELTSTPGEWPWSSYSDLSTGAPTARCISSATVLDLFHSTPDRARELLVTFVEDEHEEPRAEADTRSPKVASLIQALGVRPAIAAAATLGHSGAAIAAALESGQAAPRPSRNRLPSQIHGFLVARSRAPEASQC